MNKDMMIYRKRLIPQECIALRDDNIVYVDEQRVVAHWNTINPRTDIAKGCSAYLLDKGYKISKVYDHQNQLVYWYCDIITSIYDTVSNSLTVTDLLVDVIIMKDGSVKVLDLNELAEALKQGLLSPEDACEALEKTDKLLQDIYKGRFIEYQKLIERYE